MRAQEAAAIASAVVASISLAFAAVQYYRQRRDAWLGSIVEGTKESSAVAAMRLRRSGPSKTTRVRRSPGWRRRKRDEIQALCLAAIFQSSGRSRALIYDALRHVASDRDTRAELREFIDAMTGSIARAAGYTDLSGAARRVQALRGALALDGGPRLRVTAADLLALNNWPCTCGRPLHRPAELAGSLRNLEQLILLCPPGGAAAPQGRGVDIKGGHGPSVGPIICLDFHRPAKPKQKRSTPAAGSLVRQAKYGVVTDLSGPSATDLLAGRLTVVLKHSATYRAASHVVAVPSTHRLAADLARRVAREAGLEEDVTLEASEFAGSGFEVRGDARGRTVVLVDDVYRTGRTYTEACAALEGAGVVSILGLVATCTFTASPEACGLDELDRVSDRVSGAT